MIYPIAGEPRKTQDFDANPLSYRPYGIPAHEGVDWGINVGTPILSVSNAKVYHALSNTGAYGTCVKTTWQEDGKTFKAYYAHLSSMSVKVGDMVAEGQEVGKSGNTGRSTGPHLHFSLLIDGMVTPSKHGGNFYGFVNPLDYLNKVSSPPIELPGDIYTIVANGLNIRVEPNTAAKIITVLKKGTKIHTVPDLYFSNNTITWVQLLTPQYFNGINVGGLYVAKHQKDFEFIK